MTAQPALPVFGGGTVNPASDQLLPPWHECDLFCINSYAGVPSPPCGWRGRSYHALWDGRRQARLCPRCLRPTLLDIHRDDPPFNATEAPPA
jgi:hypothetical protein